MLYVYCWLRTVQGLNETGRRRLDERCKKNNAMLAENCELLCYCAASGDSFLRTFRFNISYPFSGIKNAKKYMILEDGTDIFNRNGDNELPLLGV